MNQQTVDRLVSLNRKFYETVAEEFAATRQSPWPGWGKTLAYIESGMSVLDVGCGNGRFGKFLHDRRTMVTYTGIDSSEKLLAKARENVPGGTFIPADITGYSGSSEVVVLFGVLHHIPSFSLRRQVLSRLVAQKFLIVSCWQFPLKKAIGWDVLGITAHEVETGDFLLGWNKREGVYRYCHMTTEAEMKRLTEDLPLRLVETFTADGKSDQLNRYYVWKQI